MSGRKYSGTFNLLYALILFLSLMWCFGKLLPSHMALGGLILSGALEVITFVRLHALLKEQVALFSRLKVEVPSVVGAILSLASVFLAHSQTKKWVGVLELVGWLVVGIRYVHSLKDYKLTGHGWLPKNCAVKPKIELLRKYIKTRLVWGAFVLTSGRVATWFRQSVGHAELLIRMKDGSVWSFSCLMESGAVINPIEKQIEMWEKSGDHYVICELRKPLTDEQVEKLTRKCEELLERNRHWRDQQNAWRHKLVYSYLGFLPQAWKDSLYKRIESTGYGWGGMVSGKISSDHWTCYTAGLRALEETGVDIGEDEHTGLFGWGSYSLDPYTPESVLCNKKFRYVTESEIAAAGRCASDPACRDGIKTVC